jgi:hypothetical protein
MSDRPDVELIGGRKWRGLAAAEHHSLVDGRPAPRRCWRVARPQHSRDD